MEWEFEPNTLVPFLHCAVQRQYNLGIYITQALIAELHFHLYLSCLCPSNSKNKFVYACGLLFVILLFNARCSLPAVQITFIFPMLTNDNEQRNV